MERDVDIREVEAAAVRPLRTEVLRPHLRGGRLAEFEGDDAPDTHHFVARDAGGAIVAVISYMRATPPEALAGEASGADSQSWRLRGMAVAEDRRGEGLGGRLLEATLGRMQILEPSIRLVWCNARTSAAEFYEEHGFQRHGEVFEVPEIGAHVVMGRRVTGAIA